MPLSTCFFSLCLKCMLIYTNHIHFMPHGCWLHFSFYTSATCGDYFAESCDLIDFQFSDLVALEWDDFCFSSVLLLLHRTSCTFNSQILKNICWSILLNFNWSEKNILKDYLIVGKLCLPKGQISCRADCCVREHRGNDHKLKIGNGTFPWYLET